MVALLHEFIKYFSVERGDAEIFFLLLFCLSSCFERWKTDKAAADDDANNSEPEKNSNEFVEQFLAFALREENVCERRQLIMPSNLTVLFIAGRKLIHCRYDANACSRALGGVYVCVLCVYSMWFIYIFLLLVFIFKLLIWTLCRDVVCVCVVVECVWVAKRARKMLRDNNRNKNYYIFLCSRFNCLLFLLARILLRRQSAPASKRMPKEPLTRSIRQIPLFIFGATADFRMFCLLSRVFRFRCPKC